MTWYILSQYQSIFQCDCSICPEGANTILLSEINWTCWQYNRSLENDTLTHWGWVMQICVSELTIIGSDNGLSPGRCQAIIWTNAGIMFIWTLGTNFSEILSEIHRFIQENAFQNVVCQMAAILSQPQCVSCRFKCLWQKMQWYQYILFHLTQIEPHILSKQSPGFFYHLFSFLTHMPYLWNHLNHCGLVMPYGDRDLGQH